MFCYLVFKNLKLICQEGIANLKGCCFWSQGRVEVDEGEIGGRARGGVWRYCSGEGEGDIIINELECEASS